jgi:hypothetical protein
LRAKAEFGLGRIEVCRALADRHGDLDAAKQRFGAVTAAFERGLVTSKAVASEAYARDREILPISDRENSPPLMALSR